MSILAVSILARPSMHLLHWPRNIVGVCFWSLNMLTGWSVVSDKTLLVFILFYLRRYKIILIITCNDIILYFNILCIFCTDDKLLGPA